MAELKSRTVFSFTARQGEVTRRERGRSCSGDGLKQGGGRGAEAAGPERACRTTASSGRSAAGEYPTKHATTYAVETEPGVFAVVYRLSDEPHLSRPPKADGPAVLYVSHHSADAELRDEPLVRELLKAEPKATFYACDVRGIGESRPDTCGADQFLKPYGSDYFYAIHSLMLDRPYVGQKTYDLLRVLDWLADHGHTGSPPRRQGLGQPPGDVRRRPVGRGRHG